MVSIKRHHSKTFKNEFEQLCSNFFLNINILLMQMFINIIILNTNILILHTYNFFHLIILYIVFWWKCNLHLTLRPT